MSSILIVGKNKKKRDVAVQQLLTERGIDPLDVTVVEKDPTLEGKQAKLTIGIDAVKSMQKKLFFKPLKSQQKAIILQDSDSLTLEAQNALLKMLEEPPNDTVIILSSPVKDALLPTILSRCIIVAIQDEEEPLSDKERTNFEDVLSEFRDLSVSKALTLAEKTAKDKQEALVWLEKAIIAARNALLTAIQEGNESAYIYLKVINTLQKTHTIVKTTNTNLRLTLEHCFLSLSQ
ncbi:MAG: hypothetical protein HY430_00580 [Candidatus Levybacteria bacterium]|nr:hypothetical protein [Candidatus Levybacteria bacterium]